MDNLARPQTEEYIVASVPTIVRMAIIQECVDSGRLPALYSSYC